MNNNKFTALLTKTARAAFKHRTLMEEVNEECVKRYGIRYSDIDADSIIDALDILGAEKMTAKAFDEEMVFCGCKSALGNKKA